MSMLVKKTFETNGVVEDCGIVMSASNKYRRGQDNIAAFVCERIVKTGNNDDIVQKKELTNELKEWFLQEQTGRKIPKSQEIYDYLDKKFGNYKEKSIKNQKAGWCGIKIIYPEDDTDAIEELDN